jgi:hypothetical protein
MYRYDINYLTIAMPGGMIFPLGRIGIYAYSQMGLFAYFQGVTVDHIEWGSR